MEELTNGKINIANHESFISSSKVPESSGSDDNSGSNVSAAALEKKNSSGKVKMPKIPYKFLSLLIVIALFGGIVFLLMNKKQTGEFLRPLGTGQGSMDRTNMVMAPLTGEFFPSGQANWKDKRPLAVMVNNHVDARPQVGLVDADIVYEVVAEGGITRFLAFFNTTIPEKIGPIRSTREYYLVIVKELGDAMLMHIGWSPQALEAIETWPVRSLGRGGASFFRENPRNVAVEHTAYANGADLIETGMNLGWEGTTDEFTPWAFKDDNQKYSLYPDATNVSIDFWFRGDYSAIWEYDSATNSYLRSMGYDAGDNPIPHVDDDSGEQISVKNLVIQFAVESDVAGDDKGRLEYELVSTGDGLVFIDGKVLNVTWSKDGRDERTLFYDEAGEQVEFNRGKTWISIVPDRNVEQVVY